MKIDLDDLIDCSECGCVFNFTTNAKVRHETGFPQTRIFIKKCPCCKKEHMIWDN